MDELTRPRPKRVLVKRLDITRHCIDIPAGVACGDEVVAYDPDLLVHLCSLTGCYEGAVLGCSFDASHDYDHEEHADAIFDYLMDCASCAENYAYYDVRDLDNLPVAEEYELTEEDEWDNDLLGFCCDNEIGRDVKF